MKMFILGALTMYLASCTIACILELTNKVDIWRFGEVYFAIPLCIILFPYKIYRSLPKALHDARVLRKYGYKPVGRYCQFDNGDTEVLTQLKKELKNQKIRLYIDDIIFARLEEEEEE